MSHGASASWYAAAAVSIPARKTFPIKKNDAEPLTRDDIQFDLLYHIFSDTNQVFSGPKPNQRQNFCELYVNALYNSSRGNQVVRDKMRETPAFGIEFAQVALLANVGRINTTMAFFPEMKTALRTYHPIPSLQRTDGNVQDAPRIKTCLKGCFLPREAKEPPNSPNAILAIGRAGIIPTTNVVNLIFVLVNHAQQIGTRHFEQPLDFLDLFLPSQIPSHARARAFLWLMFHYLEGDLEPSSKNPGRLVDKSNPFDDPDRPGCLPALYKVSMEEISRENIDPPDEIEWGHRMAAQRHLFLRKLLNVQEEKPSRSGSRSSPRPDDDYGSPSPNLPRQVPSDFAIRSAGRRRRIPDLPERTSPISPPDSGYHNVPNTRQSYNLPPLPAPPTAHGLSDRTSRRSIDDAESSQPFYEPQQFGELPRTMLQHAWHIATTTDALMESDDENADEHVRMDYERRLLILTRLRGKEPTPEPHLPAHLARVPRQNQNNSVAI